MPVAHYNFRTFIEVVISSVQVRFTQEITVATRFSDVFALGFECLGAPQSLLCTTQLFL